MNTLKILTSSLFFAISFGNAAFALPSDNEAKLAVARAQAKVELVSKESPAATQNVVFVNAQQRLAEAVSAMENNKNQQAVWLASQAELLAETTAGASKLAGLERTRNEIARDVDILESELRKE